MRMDRYIRLEELEQYLRRSQLEILSDHRYHAKSPVKNAAETEDKLWELMRDEAEYRQLDEIRRWAEQHAVTGDLTPTELSQEIACETAREGGNRGAIPPEAGTDKPEQNKNFVQVGGVEKGTHRP